MPLKLADWRIHAIFLKQSPAVLSITPILAMGRIAPPKSPITMIAIRLATLASAIVLGVAAANAPTSLVAQAPLVNPTSSARPVRPDAERVPTLAAPVRNAPDDSSWSPPEPVAIDDPFLDDPQPVMKEPALVVRSEALPVCECGKKNCPGVCLDPGHPEKPHFKKPGDIDRGDCPPYRYRIPDCKRAGNPHCVARWAKCGTDDKYSAWFVGGGSPFRKGRCRRPTEGTWGLDYEGLFGHANVWLRYTWGREQGGEGAYSTDGEPEFVARTHEVLGLGH